MSSAAADLFAAPAFASPRAEGGDDVDLVVDFCEAFGLPVPDDFQRLVLATVTGRTGAGMVPREAALLCPRQNGKTFGLELHALADAFMNATPLTIWSAHKFKSTRETFRRLRAYVLGTDPAAQNDPVVRERRRWLESEVLRMPEANGEEYVELRNGARIVFLARSAGSGRAFSADRLVLDEAYALTEDMQTDIVPTMAAREAGQTLYVSSHPHRTSGVLRGVRDRGRAGDPSLAYLEWRSSRSCADERCEHQLGADGCVLDDPVAWAEANPAYGSRLSPAAVETERRAMSLSPVKFARERLGWDDDPPAVGGEALPLAAWMECADPSVAAASGMRFAVDVTPDRGFAAVAVAGGVGPLVAVELVEHRRGTEWVAGRVAELVQRWAPNSAVMVDVGSSAGSLLPALAEAGVRVDAATTRDVVRACGELYDAVVQGRLRHRDQSALNAAVIGAQRRTVGDAWALSRRDPDVDISPLMAVTLAMWAVRSQPSVDYDVAASIY